MSSDNFRQCKAVPFWLEDSPLDQGGGDPVPRQVDLLVVGSGYTGLAASLAAAEGGMSVFIAERDSIGSGCSTRNGGQVSSGIKPSQAALTKLHGAKLAREIRAESRQSLAFAADLIGRLNIDCHWQTPGRYIAAHSPAEFDKLRKKADDAERDGDLPIVIVPRSEQLNELGSDRFFGGAINPQFGEVHPAKLHNGLLAAARGRGVSVAGNCEVSAIRRNGNGFDVSTARGTISARQVLIATNGYTGNLTPWHQRRVIPIGSNILATEPLPEEVARRLIPRKRMVVDTRKLVAYFRLSPDGRRLIFGGRASLSETDPLKSLPRLYDMMLGVFPYLKGTAITHTWNGFVAYTFDTLPHIGTHDGMHYAMGCCGSGVALSLYLGTKAGLRILGRPEGQTPLEQIEFQTRPLYRGNPWFLAPSVLYYRVVDQLFS